MVRLIGAVGARLFYALSALSAYFSARGSSYQRVHELVDAARNRLQTYGLVGGSLVPLSPPSRRDGGFGVVASVSGNAVTLAAGSTLTSGRCRLWDKSGGVYLDAGGVEGRVSGLTVYLADTTGLAAGDVIHADRLEVTSYAAAVALETALGTGHNGEIRVVNATNGAVILRRVVRSGSWTSVEVNFAAVTATPTGSAASVAGSVVTVSAGHSLATLAKVLRVQIVTDGTFSDVAAGQWSVSGNDVTVPQATADAVAAALGAAKSVRMHVEGVSELCIGGSSCAVQPLAAAHFYFDGAKIVYVGEWLPRFAPLFLASRKPCAFLDGLTYTALSAAADENTIGWRTSNLAGRVSVGFGMAADTSIRMGANSNFNGSAVDGVQTGLSAAWITRSVASGGTSSFAGGGSQSTNTAAATTAVEATYASGPISVRSTKGATATGMRCQ